jgi:hypothetical protein
MNNEIVNIMDSFHENTLNKYNFNSELNNEDKIKIISSVITIINNNNICKLATYYSLYEFIINNIILINSINKFDNDITLLLLSKITIICKGHDLLYKINNVLDIKINYIYYLNLASGKGTYITFLFWLNRSNKTIEELDKLTLEHIIINSATNYDDRLYKNLLKYIDKNIITKILHNLSRCILNKKIILRRIKLLSSVVDLTEHFNYMITIFTNTSILLYLHKYYYVFPYDYNSLKKLLHFISLSINYVDNVIFLKDLISILKTPYEKYLAYMIISLKYNILLCESYNNSLINKIIDDNRNSFINLLINELDWKEFILHLSNNKLNNTIFNYIISDNKFNDNLYLLFDYNINNKYILLYTKFNNANCKCNCKYNCKCNCKYNIFIIKTNYILHNLRLYAKYKYKMRLSYIYLKIFNVINELKIYVPNNKKPVLKKGSLTYQYNQQKFDSINIKEIIPGLSVINVPLHAYPDNDLIYNYRIKATYHEKLELYLIYDIDIPNTIYIDRYNLLIELHPYAKDIKNQLTHLINFINKTQCLIRWFPIHSFSNDLKIETL